MRFKVLLLILPFAIFSNAQLKRTLSGTISDAETGETLTGATVVIDSISGTASNVYGFYSLEASQGKHIVTVKFIGYQTLVDTIDLQSNQSRNFKLFSGLALDEFVVSSVRSNENVISASTGVQQLQVSEIKKIPVLFGEQDVLKTLTLTPGVKSIGEGNGGLYVRGGSNSQNLILLDEATVFNANHLLGFFSTFNSDAIKDLTLYKGTAPAEYGGRLSSVMDVRMKDGNNQHWGVNGGIGLISSRLAIEGPLVKNKGSILLSARRTYADMFLLLSPDENIKNSSLYFYDLNLKANYQLDEKNKLFLSGYFGRDVLGFSGRFGIDWGNSTGTLRWNRIWNPRLFSNTTLITSNYDYKIGIEFGDIDFQIRSNIKNNQLKQEFQYFINDNNTLNFGYSGIYHQITPGQISAEAGSGQNFTTLEDRNGLEHSLYISNHSKYSGRFSFDYGLRANLFQLIGPGTYYTYQNGITTDSIVSGSGVVKSYLYVEPRANVSYIISPAQSLKFSYTRNTQHLHMLSNATSSTPTDIWLMSGVNVKPEISDQWSLAFNQNFREDMYKFSAETYYKWMQNQIDLKDGADIMANEHVEGEILYGNGRAYGLELMLSKVYGSFTGWIGYTLSRTELNIPGINYSEWYPARYDATHDLSIVGIYTLSDRWSFSGSWVYRTGNAVTFPSGKYEVDGEVLFYYTERNGYRMPDYHRMDLGATYTFKKKRKFESSLNFSIYNAYGQKNAFSIDFEQDPDDPSKTQAVKTYLFTYMPSVTYNFKF